MDIYLCKDYCPRQPLFGFRRGFFRVDCCNFAVENHQNSVKYMNQKVIIITAQGYTMKEISDHICRSFDTVKFYRRQLFEKLDVANITEAIAFATNYGLL